MLVNSFYFRILGTRKSFFWLIFLSLTFFIFMLGFWNGHHGSDRHHRKEFQQNSGSGRKLQLSGSKMSRNPTPESKQLSLSTSATTKQKEVAQENVTAQPMNRSKSARNVNPSEENVATYPMKHFKSARNVNPSEENVATYPMKHFKSARNVNPFEENVATQPMKHFKSVRNVNPKDDPIEENEAILDVQEAEITRVKPKPMDRNIAKLNASNLKLPQMVQRSIFPFTSLRHTMTSMKNPLRYASVLAQTRLSLELGEQCIDISKYSAPKTVSKAILDSESILAKTKLPLESAPNYFLGDLIPPNDAKHILVITSWRSGSTFLSDILNHYPGTFYSFEPLHVLGRYYKTDGSSQMVENEINATIAGDAIDLMSNIFRCNFDKSSMGYLSHAAQPANQFLFRHNFRIWNICSTLLPANSACFMPEFYRQVCPLFPIRLMKTVRLRVQYIMDLLKDPEIGPKLKVIMLVRDPRGVMKSRSAMSWCENPQCSNPEYVCKDLDNDIDAALNLRKLFPNRMFLLRYEDLSLDPFTMTDEILKFVGLKNNKLVEKFLETHTQSRRPGTPEVVSTGSDDVQTTQSPNIENPYSTSRDSRATAFAWKSKMDLEYMQHIQDLCYRPMEKLGYKLIKTLQERDDPDFKVLERSADDISKFRLHQEI